MKITLETGDIIVMEEGTSGVIIEKMTILHEKDYYKYIILLNNGDKRCIYDFDIDLNETIKNNIINKKSIKLNH